MGLTGTGNARRDACLVVAVGHQNSISEQDQESCEAGLVEFE